MKNKWGYVVIGGIVGGIALAIYLSSVSSGPVGGERISVSREAMQAAIEKKASKGAEDQKIAELEEFRKKYAILMTAQLLDQGIDARVYATGATLVFDGDDFTRPVAFRLVKDGILDTAKVGEFTRVRFRGKSGTFDFDVK